LNLLNYTKVAKKKASARWMTFHSLNPVDLIPHWLDIRHIILILLVREHI